MAQETSPAFDPNVLQAWLEVMGPGVWLGDVIDLYRRHAPERMLAIQQALKDGDGQALREAAHALRSMGTMLGAIGLSQLCTHLETMAKTGFVGGHYDDLLQDLQNNYEQTLTALVQCFGEDGA